jgi:predicted amidophosphoribosyltransferase
MHNRHVARVCHACEAPMAREQCVCWRCGTQWASEHVAATGESTRVTLPVMPLAEAA